MTIKNLIRISQAEEQGLPFKASTLYAWRHRRKHPQIFVTIGGAAFVDLQKLDELAEAGRGDASAARRRKKR